MKSDTGELIEAVCKPWRLGCEGAENVGDAIIKRLEDADVLWISSKSIVRQWKYKEGVKDNLYIDDMLKAIKNYEKGFKKAGRAK